MEDMRRDVELLNAMLNEAAHVHDIVTGNVAVLSAKQVADWTDRSIQTVSDYRVGKTNIPVDFWRSLFERTADLRIIALLVPLDAFHVEINSRRDPGPDTPVNFFRETLEAEAEYHAQQKALCEILADGAIDDLDARRVTLYDDAFWRHRRRDADLHRAVLSAYRRYARKVGAP